MAYFTKADVKLLIGIIGTNDDVFLDDDLIPGVIDDVEKRTGRLFVEPVTAEMGHNAIKDVDGLKLFLLDWATEITSVTNGDGVVVAAGDRVSIGEGRLNTAPFYEIHLKSGSGLSWQPGSSPEGAIVVDAKWAYSADVPSDLNNAMIRLCSFRFLTRKEKDDKLPRWVDETIDRYSMPFKVIS